MNIKRTTYRGCDRTRIREKEGVTFLTFPALDEIPWLRHAFSTRLGGVSSGAVQSMNLGFGCEENAENVRENYRRFAGAAGFRPEQMVLSKQTHTTNIRLVTREDEGYGYTKERDYDDTDGLITNESGPVLVTFYADCVPLLVADCKNRAIGSAHSGWKGTVHDMGGSVLEAMRKAYGTMPEDVVCVIGPSICQDCYEVSEDVIEQFAARFGEDSDLWYRKENGKYQLNLQNACRQNFLLAGVPDEHIHIADLCTCCNPGLLFSHRASGGKRGNLAAFMQIKDDGR